MSATATTTRLYDFPEQFRAEAYNAFNNVNFIRPSLALYTPSTFGEYQNAMPPPEMQFALRYEF